MSVTLKIVKVALTAALICLSALSPKAWALSSVNIPLDSPIYGYIEKLAGFGLILSDVTGVKPFSKAEAARLLIEAEENLVGIDPAGSALAEELVARLRELVPRESTLRREGADAPFIDYNPISSARLRYVYLDGEPRSFTRQVIDQGHQSAFGLIGGDLRPQGPDIVNHFGTEGTPLLENNEGVAYRDGNNAELRWSMEGYLGRHVSLFVEPVLLATGEEVRVALQKGYLKIGGGGLELEVGRDANWFGPGRRGALTLTNNAKNFDLVKLSSPEPLDVGWIKRYMGELKYAFILSRFDETGAGETLRRPYFVGIKLALKPAPWFEIGGNFVRQEGGPGHPQADTSFQDLIFGGGYTDTSNTIAGIDLRFRIPWLRNTEIYGEYAGEDSALFWPFVESYVAGVYVPRLTADGRNDLRFEFFYGNPILYIDHNYPVTGYTFHGMPVGHSQGGATIEFYLRYGHWFSSRNTLALELFRTDRGHEGRVAGQAVERKHVGRLSWTLPVYGDLDMELAYGAERIENFNLVPGTDRTNQLLRAELRYRY